MPSLIAGVALLAAAFSAGVLVAVEMHMPPPPTWVNVAPEDRWTCALREDLR